MNKGKSEFDVRPGSIRAIPRRHLATAEETALRNCKVRVTMYLDADIIEHFKERAARPNAAPYQTQINFALREHLQREGRGNDYLRLVEDDVFIAAVAQRLGGRIGKS